MQVSIYMGEIIPEKKDYTYPFRAFEWDEILPEIVAKNVWSGCIWEDEKRNRENFIQNELAVLDFDDPGHSVDDWARRICDQWHIIGTTRNHQKNKNGKGIICDRFRVITRFDRPIKVLEHYEQVIRGMIKKEGADTQCGDGGRYFFPCTKIVSVNLDLGAYTHSVPDYKETPQRKPTQHVRLGTLSDKARRIIRQGCIGKETRNNTILWCYRHLLEAGFDEDTGFSLASSKISLPERELLAIQKSGKKLFLKKQ